MRRVLVFVALFATMSCVTFTSCKKKTEDEKVTTINGSYLCLNDYDFFEVLAFSENGSLNSQGFYGNKSGEEVGYWSNVTGNYKIDGNIIDLIFEDGDNSKGSYHLNDYEFVFIDDNEGTTTVYKKLTETDNKNIIGNWKSYNMCMMNDPKEDYIVFPDGQIEPFPTAELDGTIVRDIVDYIFNDITFKDNGEFVFNYSYSQSATGTYANNNNLNLTLTFNVNDVPMDINCSLAQNVSKNESYIFIGKEGCLKLSMSYLYQKLLEYGYELSQEGINAFYQQLDNTFNDFAIAVSLMKQ